MSDDAKLQFAFIIFAAAIFAVMFIGSGIKQKNHADCIMKAMELKYSADEITKICK